MSPKDISDREGMGATLIENDETPQKNQSHASTPSSLTMFVVVASFIAAIGSFSFGYTLSFTSPAILSMEVLKSDSVLGSYHIEDKSGTVSIVDTRASWFSSITNLGGLAGSFLGGWLSDRYGRRSTLIILAVPLCATWLWIAFESAFPALLTARFINGVSVGISTVTVPVYIAEIAPVSSRGMLGSLNQFMTTFGILFVNILGLLLSSRQKTSVECPGYNGKDYGKDVKECSDIVADWNCENHHYCNGLLTDWRWLAIFGAIFGFVLLLAMPFMPETPVYLAKTDPKKAREALQRLRGEGANIDMEMDQITHEIETEQNDSGSQWKALVDSRKALGIGLTILAFQQLSGVNAIIFYATSILQSSGTDNSQVGSIITFAVQFAFTGLAVMLMDRAGRKLLMMISSVGMGVFAFTMGLFFVNGKHPGWLALVSLMAYIAFFSVAMGPVPWLIMSEIFPTEARSLACSIATALNWFLAFMVTEFFAEMTVAFTTGGVFWIFAALCGLCFLFSAFVLPETKGKSFEEIQCAIRGETYRRMSLSTPHHIP